MTDLSEFLLARIAEDEADAVDASHRSAEWEVQDPREGWGVGYDDDSVVLAGGKPIAVTEPQYGGGLVSDHIARHDPTRVLNECAAKRLILALHTEHGEHMCPSEEAAEDGLWSVTDQDVMRPCPTLRALIAAYAAHPDYQQEWRA